MKLKSLLFIVCLSVLTTVFADNRHNHSKINAAATAKNTMSARACEIEIVNSSYSNVTVHGMYDDGPLEAFRVYSFGEPQYIDMIYGFDPLRQEYICYPGLYLDIVADDGYRVYSGYTPHDSKLTIVPYLTNQVRVDVHTK